MSTNTILEGIAAADGIAIGPALVYVPPTLEIKERPSGTPQEEIDRYSAASAIARAELAALQEKMAARTDEATAAIFEAHALILDDPMLTEAIGKRVEQGLIVEKALAEAIDEIATMLAGLGDELFAARAADARDVGQRLLRILLGAGQSGLDGLEAPVVVAAADLTPSDTALLDPQWTLGFCTARGGLTSHTAILARTLGIPAVVGIGDEQIAMIASGTPLILDGGQGVIVINPTEDTCALFENKRQKREQRLAVMGESASHNAHTADGKRVEVAANIGDVESARDAVKRGAEGVGLLRTEFLYLQDTRPPSEDQQIAIYRSIFEVMGQRPVIVRTLDIGGDKPPSYLDFPHELNPFLGWRAIRICLDDLPLFKTQLRSVLRAAHGFNALLMFPMISRLEEVEQAQAILAEVRRELDQEGLPYAADVPVGIMVETPAAAMLADVLAEACDFLSIGTNDLTQYTMAVDRTNEKIAHIYQSFHPSVLRLIHQTIQSAHSKGKWVGMCGELAGMPKAIPILLGFGLDEFSMASRAIPEAKWLIGQMTQEAARRVADDVLAMKTAAEIEAYMAGVLEAHGAV